MRDILVTLLVFGSLPFILRHAYIGVLVWSWLSYMNPHRLAWGFAYSMPFAQIVAITLFAALIFSKDKKDMPLNGTVFVWVLFILWMFVSTWLAIFPDAAMVAYTKIFKTQIVIFLTMLLITNQKKMDQLIWVIVGSIGYFSVKGGLFTIMTGGAFRVYGPPSSDISENNALAVAILMIIPLMVYLHRIAIDKWIRRGLAFAIVMSLASVMGSQSRGAFLSIIAVAVFFWLKTKSKLVSGMAILFITVLGFAFMPESWHERMDTIQNYEEDESAMQRINSWAYSINIASDRIMGGGLSAWRSKTFAVYAPDPDTVFAAHSIYFSILGDHGWPGLILYLIILGLTWRSLSSVIKQTRSGVDSHKNHLARMLQVSLIAYMSGGAFLSLSYFDLPWHLFAIALLLKHQLINAKNDDQLNSKNLPIRVNSQNPQ
jgi:probable O-glycosylation ligase (exosortase A-associated)